MQYLLILSCSFGFSFKASAKDAIVLVPGFFNSFAPEYFSQDIIKSFQHKGFNVYVVNTLDPLGTIEANGNRLIPILKNIRKNESGRLQIVAHSAGGFYSLFALQNGSVEVDSLVTVSTPYLGLDFIKVWMDNSSLFSEVLNYASLQGLRQLTPEYVAQFVDQIRVPDQLKIYTYGGWQPRSLDIWNAKNLSGILRITDHFIPTDSDGIVSFKSSMGLKNLKTKSNKSAKFVVDREHTIPLEHWEQVLDYHTFILLGTRNINVIQDRQRKFYSQIAENLMTSEYE